MRIIHIAPLSMKKTAGLTYSIPKFVEAQDRIEGMTAEILVSLNGVRHGDRYYYIDDFKDKKKLGEFVAGYDIAVFHSTYIYNHLKIAAALKKNKIPYIIVPRGGFTKESKKIKKFKKMFADILLFNKFFATPDAIHYLTQNESDNSVYHTGNDFILPNGIDIPPLEREERSRRVNRIVFIGRIDTYIKGLDALIEAANLIKSELAQEKVSIGLYGSDENGSKNYITDLITKYSLQEVVAIHEPVYGEEKRQVLMNSDIFIQTSRSEGLPMGVLEALAYGLPCILTPGTNLSAEVETLKAGMEVDFDPDRIASGILEMIENLKKENNYYENAITLAKNYSWDRIALKSISIYQDILQGRKQKR